MAIVFNCPQCGKSISAPDSGGGKRGKCPGCKSPIQVPSASGPGDDVYDADIVEDDVYDADVVEDAPADDPQAARRAEKQRRVADAFAQFSESKEQEYDEPDDYDEERPRPRRGGRQGVDDFEEERPRRRPRPASYDDDEVDDDQKQCPSCGELIKRRAMRCRYCGEEFRERGRRRSGRRRSSGSEDNGLTLGILSLVIGLFCCAPAGIILGINGLNKANSSNDPSAGTAKVLCIIGITLSTLGLIANIVFVAMGGMNNM